eukprot:scaffold123615_cov43-Attheya_sp.AAC.3
MSVGYMLHISSDAATTRSDHVRNNAWERISVAVGRIGYAWWVVVAEPWGVVVGVEGAMVSRLLLLIVACYSGVVELGRKISRRQKSVRWARSSKELGPYLSVLFPRHKILLRKVLTDLSS